MIQRITLILFLAIIAISFCYADQNAQTDKPKQDKPAAAQSTEAQSSKIIGVIDKVDLTRKTITFRADDSKQIQEIAFNESTVFQNQNAPLKPEDLKNGDRVAIDVDSTNTITRLEFQSSTAAEQPQKQQ
jgi:Cu/Ag efflux protein CusF